MAGDRRSWFVVLRCRLIRIRLAFSFISHLSLSRQRPARSAIPAWVRNLNTDR